MNKIFLIILTFGGQLGLTRNDQIKTLLIAATSSVSTRRNIQFVIQSEVNRAVINIAVGFLESNSHQLAFAIKLITLSSSPRCLCLGEHFTKTWTYFRRFFCSKCFDKSALRVVELFKGFENFHRNYNIFHPLRPNHHFQR